MAGEAVWPEKMITQAEAFALAASWAVKAVVSWDPAADTRLDDPGIALMCQSCGRSTGQLRRGGVPYNGSLDEMLSMVLRHMVQAHDIPLAGLRRAEAHASGT
jgi:hypothetical protein